jgi:hypothetical protein
MTLTYEQLQKVTDVATQEITEKFSYDAWRQTALLLGFVAKSEGYLSHLAEEHSDKPEFRKAAVMADTFLTSLCETYSIPVDDERYEEVLEFYNASVEFFISELSDDAGQDLLFIGALMNYVSGMRVEAWASVIEHVGPDENRFNALKLAKRDAELTALYLETLVEAV